MNPNNSILLNNALSAVFGSLIKYKIIVQLATASALIILSFNSLFAQKLSGIQQGSLLLPSDFKLDGKADEWNGKFQAYNPATELFYTIANNDKFLYLAVQTHKTDVIDHISGGGVTLAITKAKTDSSNEVSITYPARTDRLIHVFAVYSPKKGDTSSAAAIIAMNRKNEKMEKLSKWIKVTGISGLDTISVYNEAGIQAVGRFDVNQNFTIEMVIPMSLIKNITDTSTPFAYQVRINGGRTPGSSADKTVERNRELRGFLSAEEEAKLRRSVADLNERLHTVYNSTIDFWGEYILAK